MFAIRLNTLARVAKSLGYTGDPIDGEAMRAYLLGLDEPVSKIDVEGVEVDVKTATITFEKKEPEKKARTVKAEPDPEPRGLDVLVRERVEAALKAMGIAGTLAVAGAASGAPPVLPADRVEVKSVEEAWFENQVQKSKSGLSLRPAAAITSYPVLKMWHSYLAMLGTRTNEYGDPEAAARHVETIKTWGERTGRYAKKDLTTSSVTGGSALVATTFLPELIKHRDTYGVARRIARVINMPSESIEMPRRTGGTTAQFQTAQLSSVTRSNPTYDNVALTAKTVMAETVASRQVLDDSAIDLAAEIFDELAYAITKLEDDTLIKGDGTATYGGITGFLPKYGTSASDGGYIVVGGGTSDAHTMANIHVLMARLPERHRAGAVFLVHPELAPLIFDRLGQAQGGVLLRETVEGGYLRTFLGRPVVESNSMNSNPNNGDVIDVLYGSFADACKFGQRLSLELAVSTERYFELGAIGFRAMCRFDVNVHDVGSASAAGPVVSFWQT